MLSITILVHKSIKINRTVLFQDKAPYIGFAPRLQSSGQIHFPGNKMTKKTQVYPSYFKLRERWLPSLPPVTYLSKLLGIHSVAVFLQLELFRV
ncbi:hypothetical protein NM75_03195 [Dickeya fangzhongdai]|nr:hypothetical protein NM75_03195 [Dickeya fangzhongdai]